MDNEETVEKCFIHLMEGKTSPMKSMISDTRQDDQPEETSNMSINEFEETGRENRAIWPGLSQITSGASVKAPFWDTLETAKQVIAVVEGINLSAAKMISEVMENNENLKWQLNLGLQPAGYTTQESLRYLWNIKQTFPDRFGVQIILPRQIRGHWPKYNLSLIQIDDGSWKASIGSSPSLGIDVSIEPFLNLWFRVEGKVYTQVAEFLNAMFMIGCPFTEKSLDIPHLILPRGSAEGAEVWKAYEELISRRNDEDQVVEQSDNGPTIDDVEVDPDNGVVYGEGKSFPAKAPPTAIPYEPDALADRVAALFDLCYQSIVGRMKLPPAAPLKPEWFGLESFSTGRIKVKTSASIDLLDATDQKALEKRRKVTSNLVNLLGFSLSDGVRLIPQKSLELFDREIQTSDTQAAIDLEQLFQGYTDDPETAVDKFLKSRKNAITEECREKYKRLHPDSGGMPETLVKNVLDALKVRALEFLKKKISASYSFHKFAFDIYNHSEGEHVWHIAARFLESVYSAPREFLKDQYGFRKLSGTGISVVEYLEHLNIVQTDPFFQHPELIRWNKTGNYLPGIIAEKASMDLQIVRRLKELELPHRRLAEELYSLLDPRYKSEKSGHQNKSGHPEESSGPFQCPECESKNLRPTVFVTTKPDLNDPWSLVLQFTICDECESKIPNHLGNRWGSMSFLDARIQWVKIYRAKGLCVDRDKFHG